MELYLYYPHVFMVWYFIKHKDNFTFAFIKLAKRHSIRNKLLWFVASVRGPTNCDYKQFEFLLSPPLTAKVKLLPLSEGTPPGPTFRVGEDGLRATSNRSLPTEAPRKNHTPARPSAEAHDNKR